MMGYNNIFIAKTNVNKKDNKNNLSMAAIFYCAYMLSIFLMLYLFLQKFLMIWLGSTYSATYYDLIKIFLLIVIMNSFSSLLTDYYDLIGRSKFNTYVEIVTLLPFIIGIMSPISSSEKFNILFCSSKLHACTSDECPLMVRADIPSVKAQVFMCFLLDFSSI